jgi:hypothetical protein
MLDADLVEYVLYFFVPDDIAFKADISGLNMDKSKYESVITIA